MQAGAHCTAVVLCRRRLNRALILLSERLGMFGFHGAIIDLKSSPKRPTSGTLNPTCTIPSENLAGYISHRGNMMML